MGDLIQKLPTDNTPMTVEERENFSMLFPPTQEQYVQPPATTPLRDPRKNLKREFFSILMFVVVFFVLNLPYVRGMIEEYIPICNKSWALTNLVQATVFAFILWIVMNSEHART
jgi:hypothetical protein